MAQRLTIPKRKKTRIANPYLHWKLQHPPSLSFFFFFFLATPWQVEVTGPGINTAVVTCTTAALYNSCGSIRFLTHCSTRELQHPALFVCLLLVFCFWGVFLLFRATPKHMEVPRPGVEWELYVAADLHTPQLTATLDP